ncbi:hypothetical protein GCM10027034_33330 [Ramlibacter solisilvae]|uniref:HTH luxR-type domain-containing protein n=1 Tax=Ramlibacter tataouinensis TaxID=94132 RepID=A0A127JSD2_9BURK|nr:LuxR C-terminal-related transcriptional regulator [Ramlibacter tataouinensis]AMO22850.1 hypothetical protein UC35_08040 [Ramlibacter tataouinensis]
MNVRLEQSPTDLLDERELTVFRLLARGVTHAEAASELHLPPKTIGLVSRAICAKLPLGHPIDLWHLTRKCLLANE